MGLLSDRQRAGARAGDGVGTEWPGPDPGTSFWDTDPAILTTQGSQVWTPCAVPLFRRRKSIAHGLGRPPYQSHLDEIGLVTFGAGGKGIRVFVKRHAIMAVGAHVYAYAGLLTCVGHLVSPCRYEVGSPNQDRPWSNGGASGMCERLEEPEQCSQEEDVEEDERHALPAGDLPILGHEEVEDRSRSHER